jgi:hypothetical protein
VEATALNVHVRAGDNTLVESVDLFVGVDARAEIPGLDPAAPRITINPEGTTSGGIHAHHAEGFPARIPFPARPTPLKFPSRNSCMQAETGRPRPYGNRARAIQYPLGGTTVPWIVSARARDFSGNRGWAYTLLDIVPDDRRS